MTALSPRRAAPNLPAFSRYAWGVLAYILLVILYGAWVRISGSGAGCGDHWPTCHGELIPADPTTKTVIEYTHRLTSGLLGPLVIGLVAWSWMGAGKRKSLRAAALVTAALVVFEALLGAGLVLGELVADDASEARALVVALHLCNTLILVAAATVTGWLGNGNAWPGTLRAAPGVLLAMLLVVVLCMSGAVTALGDTLFPVAPTEGGGLFAHLREDLSPAAHFLVRLRIVHPVLAGLFGAILLGLSYYWSSSPHPGVAAAGRWTSGLLWLQLLLGAVNILLSAPTWLQLSHLLVAQLLWISLVVLLLNQATALSLRAPGGPAPQPGLGEVAPGS